MKKDYRFLIWLAALCIGTAHGQQCSQQDISTDPENPKNSICPNQINAFDWRIEDYPFYWNEAPNESTIKSPFWASGNGFLKPIHLPSFGGKDFHPQDGWELIRVGVAPDVINFNYVVLYNRHTSILRVLFALPISGLQYNFIEVTIGWPGGVSTPITALLHPTTGMAQPLDQISQKMAQTHVNFTNNYHHFMYADFPVEYDPCSCLVTSEIEISFKRILEQELKLVGRFVQLERTLSSIEDNEGVLENNFLTQALDGATAGSHTFGTYNALVDHYHSLRAQQAELNASYQRLQAFNQVIGAIGAVGAPLIQGIKLKGKIAEFLTDDGTNDGFVIETDISGGQLLTSISGIANLFGGSIRDLSTINNQVASLGATNFGHGEIVLQGDIKTDVQDSRAIIFPTPGSFTSCENELYPSYNEVLGRFALLKTPEASIQQAFFTSASTAEPYNTVRIQFDPSSLNYVLNPAASINTEKTEIWAALQFVKDYPVFSHNLQVMDDISPSGIPSVLQTPLMPLSCLGGFIAGFNGVATNSALPDEVFLKLFVEYHFLDGGHTLQLYTYPVKLLNIGDPIFDPPMEAVTNSTNVYADYLTIGTVNFTESQTIFAWSGINIAGDLTAEPGVKVEILAPDIQVLDESFIGSDIWLRNSDAPYGCLPILEYPYSLLSSYCTGPLYKAKNSSLAPPPGEEALAQPPAPVPPAPGASLAALHVEAYPNPLSGYATLRLLLPEEGAVSASLSDLQGRPLRQVLPAGYLPAGEHLFDLPAHDLPPGMYLLTVQTAQGRQSIKLVKR